MTEKFAISPFSWSSREQEQQLHGKNEELATMLPNRKIPLRSRVIIHSFHCAFVRLMFSRHLHLLTVSVCAISLLNFSISEAVSGTARVSLVPLLLISWKYSLFVVQWAGRHNFCCSCNKKSKKLTYTCQLSNAVEVSTSHSVINNFMYNAEWMKSLSQKSII